MPDPEKGPKVAPMSTSDDPLSPLSPPMPTKSEHPKEANPSPPVPAPEDSEEAKLDPAIQDMAEKNLDNIEKQNMHTIIQQQQLQLVCRVYMCCKDLHERHAIYVIFLQKSGFRTLVANPLTNTLVQSMPSVQGDDFDDDLAEPHSERIGGASKEISGLLGADGSTLIVNEDEDMFKDFV